MISVSPPAIFRRREIARDRLAYWRKQRIACEGYATDTDQSQHTLRKLRDDEKRPQLDCSWAEHRLSEVLATDETTTVRAFSLAAVQARAMCRVCALRTMAARSLGVRFQ